MIEIVIDNAHCQLNCSFEAFKSLRDVLSYEVEGAVFARQRSPYWDGRVRLMDKKGIFPTGLLERLTSHLEETKTPFKLTDVRNKPLPTFDRQFQNRLPSRPYQITASELSDNHVRGVYKMGTGAGKTWTAALIIQRRKVETLFVAPDTGLREQVYENFVSWFGPKFVSTDITSDAPIIVTNIQALATKAPSLFTRFKMLIIDEFHHSAATTYQKLNQKAINAFYRYGFTGTFMRSDGSEMEMHGVLSNVIFSIATSDLVEQGFLVKPYITFFAIDLAVNGRKLKMNYQTAYDYVIKHKPFNDLVAATAKQKIAEGKQTLVLVRRKDHGKILSEQIDGCIYLSGDDPSDYREKIKAAFIAKKLRCIVATNIFGEGIDIPSIDVLINARCQKTEIQTSQGIGRALRKYDGKDKAEVFDFMFMGQKHLEDHSVERYRSYRKERAFQLQVKRAPRP